MTWIVFDQFWVSNEPRCVRLMVNDSSVPSIDAKKVVWCRRTILMNDQTEVDGDREYSQ